MTQDESAQNPANGLQVPEWAGIASRTESRRDAPRLQPRSGVQEV